MIGKLEEINNNLKRIKTTLDEKRESSWHSKFFIKDNFYIYIKSRPGNFLFFINFSNNFTVYFYNNKYYFLKFYYCKS